MNLLKIKTLTIIVLIILLIIVNVIQNTSAEIIRDVEIKIILENPEPQVNYTELFRVNNLDHQTGTTDLLHFYINASLKNNETNTTWNATRSMNKYTQTGMGSLILESGEYTLCVTLIPINFEDYNSSNNEDCKIIRTNDFMFNETDIIEEETNNLTNNITINESEIENETTINICDCKLKIITEKEIYDEGESISFIILDCLNTSSFETPITYWVEDLFGEITKNKLNTTSKNSKSYTPKTNKDEKTLLIKSKLEPCESVFEKIIIIKGLKEEKSTFIEILAPKEAKFGDIIIIELKGYKGKTLKTLIDIHLELDEKRKSDILKIYIPKQEQDFHFKIPLQIPENLDEGLFEYLLVAKGLDELDSTSILINKQTEEKIKEKVGKINNIYTRKQKFDEEINIIISWEGLDEAKILITTQKEIKEIETTLKTITTPIKIRTHNETIIVELINDNETVDVAILKLNLDVNEEELEKIMNKNSQIKEEQKKQTTNEYYAEQKKEEQKEQQTMNEDVQIQEEQNKAKQTNKITLNTTSFMTEYKKQTIFATLGTISIIFLFRKEIITQTKKIKKKLIKII